MAQNSFLIQWVGPNREPNQGCLQLVPLNQSFIRKDYVFTYKPLVPLLITSHNSIHVHLQRLKAIRTYIVLILKRRILLFKVKKDIRNLPDLGIPINFEMIEVHCENYSQTCRGSKQFFNPLGWPKSWTKPRMFATGTT